MQQPPGSFEQQAALLLSQMTLKEKANEMHGEGLKKLVIGILTRGHLLPVHAGGSKRLGIPSISFTDGPRGVGTAVSTNFPVTMARGASWDADLEKRIGEAMGTEARCAGANYSGAVCINLLRHPSWGRSQETYGEDPWHLGEMGSALVTGIQKHNVMACLKHFALNSIENSRFLIDVNVDERSLHEVYLPHFKKCIEAGAASVMTAYNKVGGEYCGENKYLLSNVLRNEWGFRGFITSDWFWGVRNTEKGIKAGMNVEMPSKKFYKFSKIKKLLNEGKITMEDIDKLALPFIRTKLEWASRKDFMNYTKNLLACDAHRNLARETAEKSAVLLKNENVILPLKKDAIRKLAIVGSVAKTKNDGDHASSKVKSPYVVTPYDGIKNYLGSEVEILYAGENDLEGIRRISREADAVIVVAGFKYTEEGEYIHLLGKRSKPGKLPLLAKLGIASKGDRVPLALHERDLKVIKVVTSVTDKAIVCLAGGGAITMEGWKEKVSAILMTFYNGMEGGNALARILFGDVSPSGKLPFTIPQNESDLPFFDSYADKIAYEYYHGYTLFDKFKKKPAFPFGFGLSYTTFFYSNLQVLTAVVKAHNDVVRISVDVENTGSVSGEEIIQVYIGFSKSKIDRPVKLLRGFKKIWLTPGEKKTASFEIKTADLSYYDVLSGCWMVELMEHEVFAGKSSVEEDLPGAVFTVN